MALNFDMTRWRRDTPLAGGFHSGFECVAPTDISGRLAPHAQGFDETGDTLAGVFQHLIGSREGQPYEALRAGAEGLRIAYRYTGLAEQLPGEIDSHKQPELPTENSQRQNRVNQVFFAQQFKNIQQLNEDSPHFTAPKCLAEDSHAFIYLCAMTR